MRFLERSEPREEELAALADGSLAPDRRAAVEAFVESSPELGDRLAEQERAFALVRGASATVEAPAGVRARVDEMRRPAASRRRPRGLAWAGGFAAAAAAVAAVVLLVLPGGAGGPSVAQAASLATRPPTAVAPHAASPTLLAVTEDGVPFPYWAKKFGWKATGVRVDTLRGRHVTSVYYEKKGSTIVYSIVSGRALPRPPSSSRLRRESTEYRVLTIGGRLVVTWERRGRTCVLSATGVPAAKLMKLASWNGKGSVPF